MAGVLSLDPGVARTAGDDPGQSGDVPPLVAEEVNFDDGIEEIVWSYDEVVEVTYHVTSQWDAST